MPAETTSDPLRSRWRQLPGDPPSLARWLAWQRRDQVMREAGQGQGDERAEEAG
jgi:hypothetical protein